MENMRGEVIYCVMEMRRTRKTTVMDRQCIKMKGRHEIGNDYEQKSP